MKGKIYMHTKKQKCLKDLLPLIEQMSEAIPSGKYGVVIMPDLERGFHAVCWDRAIYKWYDIGIRNNMLSVSIVSFVTNYQETL